MTGGAVRCSVLAPTALKTADDDQEVSRAAVLPLTELIERSGLMSRTATTKSRTLIAAQTDGELVRKAGKSEPSAWVELLRRFDRMIVQVARRTGLSAAEAADVQQTTWLRLMQYSDQIKDPDRVGPWLATVARRESVRAAIAADRQTPLLDSAEKFTDLAFSGSDPETIVLAKCYGPALELAISRLPVNHRRLLEMLVSDKGWTYKEIAGATGLSVGSIGPIRQRCLKRLREDVFDALPA